MFENYNYYEITNLYKELYYRIICNFYEEKGENCYIKMPLHGLDNYIPVVVLPTKLVEEISKISSFEEFDKFIDDLDYDYWFKNKGVTDENKN